MCERCPPASAAAPPAAAGSLPESATDQRLPPGPAAEDGSDPELAAIAALVAAHPRESDYPPVRGLLGTLAVGLVRVYQRLCRPIMPAVCRFHPSCSDYMILAIRKHGVFGGIPRGLARLARCHPFHPGGVDYP